MYQEIKPRRNLNPAQNANFLSKITFLSQNFNDEDVYEIIPGFGSKLLGAELQAEWNLEMSKKTPNLFRSLWKIYGLTYILLGITLLVIDTVIMILIPYLIRNIVAYFTPNFKQENNVSIMVVVAMLVTTMFLRTFVLPTYTFAVRKLFIKIKTACTALIYLKTLKLNTSLAEKSSGGQAVTLITKDLSIILEMGLSISQYLFISIVRIIIVTYLVYKQIGVSAFFGMTFLLLTIAVQAILSSRVTPSRLQASKTTDSRIQLTQEILSAIRVIKMFTWESLFCKSLDKLRRNEIRKIVILKCFKIFPISIGVLNMKLPQFICIIAYVSYGHHINAETAYAVALCFATLGFFVTFVIPYSFGIVAEVKATITRFNKYLLQQEIMLNKIVKPIDENCVGIVLKDVSLSYGNDVILNDVNFSIKPGITLITGAIGSGKSTFLKGILGNIATTGSIEICGKVSYASQEPWLFPGTIRQNIIFNEIFNKERYNNVLRACALIKDLESFTFGDDMLLKDKGLNLSQGQKLRINLARAVYKSADIYLLDDCLAGVDVQVGKHIYCEVIQTFLRSRVCVLVSHLYPFINDVNETVFLQNGRMQLQRCSRMEMVFTADIIDERLRYRHQTKKDIISTNHNNEFEEAEENSNLLVKSTECSTTNVYQETGHSGSVRKEVYYNYITAGGIKILATLITIMLVKEVTDIWINNCVRFWIDSEENSSIMKVQFGTNSSEYDKTLIHRNTLLKWYSLSLFGYAFLLVAKILIFVLFVYRASIKIHWNVAEKIINAALVYLDKTLAGNVVNRFSRDFSMIDELLPNAFLDSFELLLSSISVLIVVSLASAWLLLPSVAYGLLVFIFRYLYIPSGRNIRRIEGAVRSPVIGHMQATIDGLLTIRASEAQEMLTKEFNDHLDVYNSVEYMRNATIQAFRFYLEVLTTCYVSAVVIALLWLKGSVSASSVGLSITQSFTLTAMIQLGVQQISEFEMYMTSAERLFEYSKAESENKYGNLFSRKSINGKIVFKNVSLRYVENSTLILKNISFVIEHGERVGIVARTGAGKSSIILALLRFYSFDGFILIDDIDIHSLKLKELRSKISIVPQNPTLLSGTMRFNLDPNVEYTDNELWNALEQVKMKDKINSLDQVITANSTIFSTGEKQLLCLARVMLQNNAIIIFDEVTACVDSQTEYLLQEIISQKLVNRTIVTIAHRLRTIMDYDKILVIDTGTVAECDSPSNLLKNKDGIFYGMAKAAKLL